MNETSLSIRRRDVESRRPQKVADLILAAAFLSVVCFALPPAASLLEFNRAALAQGQLWRVFTGHLVHWSMEHALWDGVTLVALTIFSARLLPSSARIPLVESILISSVVVSATVFLLTPEFHSYRGLSGLCVAQFTALATAGLRHGQSTQDRKAIALFALLLASLFCKTVYEVAVGATIFVSDDNFVVATSAHLGGVLGGLALGAIEKGHACRFGHRRRT